MRDISYREAVEPLLWIDNVTRPDFYFVVHNLASVVLYLLWDTHDSYTNETLLVPPRNLIYRICTCTFAPHFLGVVT